MELETEILYSYRQTDKIFEALAKAQGEFKILNKTQSGYHGKYANLQDVQMATQQALSKNGLCITQAHDQSTVKSVLGHASGQHIIYITRFKDTSSQDKFKLASAWTFMRRYAILAILNVSGTEDPETYGEVSFNPDDGLSDSSQKILDDGLKFKRVDEFNQYYASKQLELKRLEREDAEEYKYIDQKLADHKKSLKKGDTK